MQQLETTADEIRSIRVDGLAPMMDEIYLFNCFCDNAKVVAATVLRNRQTGLPLDYGFVEFASHGDAEFVLDSYHGERMPNSYYERFCLSWDTDDCGTLWRLDSTYRGCSFLGYDVDGEMMDANAVIQLYDKDSKPPLTKKRPHLQSVYPNVCGDAGEAFPNYTENQPDHAKSNDLSPADYMETDVDKRLKLTYMPLTHPNMYQQGYVGPSLIIQQNQPDSMQWDGGCGAGYANDQQLTQVPKGDLERVSSMKNEKELYLCFEEMNFQRGGYVIRTIKLSELLQCSCHFSIETCEITKCDHCAPKIKLESQWRHRAWLHTGEKVRESCGAKETNMPFGMICCSYGSQIIFAGGLVRQPDRETPEWRPPLTPSGQVWSFDPETTIWQKLDLSFPRAQLSSLIFEVNGNLCCLFGRLSCPNESTFEVHNISSHECLVLPEPEVYLQGHDNRSYLVNYMSLNRFACAVVGSKILISNPALLSLAPHVPIICFDINEKEKKWRVMPSLFDGEPFPFNGRALVLDLNGTHDKVMFSFRHECLIYVSRLAEDDDTGDISIPHEACLGDPHLVRNLIKNASRLSSTFVDLGDQNKVAFVMCGTIYSGRAPIGRVRVVIVVIEYEGLGPKYVSCEIVATRTFEYDCHYSGVGRTILTGGFVVG